MTISQLSIFIENKSGTLLQVLNLLKEAGISLIASNIADTVEYGICRIICGEPARDYSVLKEAGIAVALSEVFAIEMDNEVGSAAKAISLLSDEGINITYLYSFLIDGKGVLIFRTDDAEKASAAIARGGLHLISEEALATLA